MKMYGPTTATDIAYTCIGQII